MLPLRIGLALSLALVLAGLGFGPSLLPRAWQTQGVLSGVLFLLGYVSGLALGSLARPRRVPLWPFLIPGIFFIQAAYHGGRWNEQSRVLIELPPGPAWWSIKSIFLTFAVGGILVVFLHLGLSLSRHLLARLENRIGQPYLAVVLFLLLLGIGLGLSRRVLFQHLAASINTANSGKNQQTEVGITQPAESTFSGSPDSLVSWESLGRKGRTFVATAPDQEQLSNFTGTPTTTPIRIYAGVLSDENLERRVELAVQDLKRAGGFNRRVLLVITTTGTGWVDEHGVLPLEYMYGGHTASVAIQYSYLPSVFSFIADEHRARRAGRALFEGVYQEWQSLPEDQRPLLLSYGESLGSYGAEAAFPEVELFLKRSNGALLVGPPNTNPIWQEALSKRQAGTPAILPIVGNGEVVRFARRASDLERPEGEWRHPRAVYLQNSSDPIVWWSPDLWWRKPQWLQEPPGPDVNPAMTWLPIITFLQVSADYLEARAPDGHGHRYGFLPVYAWSKIAPPEGWSQERADSLIDFLEKTSAEKSRSNITPPHR